MPENVIHTPMLQSACSEQFEFLYLPNSSNCDAQVCLSLAQRRRPRNHRRIRLTHLKFRKHAMFSVQHCPLQNGIEQTGGEYTLLSHATCNRKYVTERGHLKFDPIVVHMGFVKTIPNGRRPHVKAMFAIIFSDPHIQTTPG